MTRYAVIIETSYYVEGDERSRKNPGHGYPAHTVRYQDLQEFDSEDAMLNWVKASGKFCKYRAIKFTPLTITTETRVVAEPPDA